MASSALRDENSRAMASFKSDFIAAVVKKLKEIKAVYLQKRRDSDRGPFSVCGHQLYVEPDVNFYVFPVESKNKVDDAMKNKNVEKRQETIDSIAQEFGYPAHTIPPGSMQQILVAVVTEGKGSKCTSAQACLFVAAFIAETERNPHATFSHFAAVVGLGTENSFLTSSVFQIMSMTQGSSDQSGENRIDKSLQCADIPVPPPQVVTDRELKQLTNIFLTMKGKYFSLEEFVRRELADPTCDQAALVRKVAGLILNQLANLYRDMSYKYKWE